MACMDLNKCWGEFNIPRIEPGFWQFGPLHLWCKYENSELWIASKNIENPASSGGTDEENIQPPPPNDIKWIRYSIADDYKKLVFRPMLPDRPLVVKVEAPFLLKKGARARIFIRVPLWIKIEIKNKSNIDMLELPTIVLSNTWFGSPVEGEVCYWISSGARRSIEPDYERPYLAICSIEVINRADEDLLVDKICFRVGYLTLFSDGKQIWSNSTKVNFKGSQNFSEIDVSSKPPIEAGEAKKISEPRENPKKSFTYKTFSVLKELTDLF